MRGKRLLVAALCATVLWAAPVRPARAQILSGIVGAGAGTAAGGYLTLSYIVARAQTGHYLHDAHDLFGWTSAPVLIGAATGATLGALSPARLWTSVIFGTGGALIGIPIGMFVGARVSDRAEAKWAGGAIGAGAAMTVGFLFGVFSPQERLVPKPLRTAAVVPIGFTVRF